MHKINPLNVEELVIDIFDIQQSGSADQFRNDFSEPVLNICELIKNCYASYLQFESHKEPDSQFSYMAAYTFALVESLYTSLKLLVYGFLAPSGNQFRLALEALALSALLSWRNQLMVNKRQNKWKCTNFFEDFLEDKRWARPHLAIKILDENKERLGFSEEAIGLLAESKKLYNNYSHASLLSIRAIIISPERVLFGGGYDHEQKPLFEKELEIRKRFIEKIPIFLDTLYTKSV